MEKPVIGSRWIHSSGRIYTVELYTNLESTDQERYPTTIVYSGINRVMWSRPLTDWHRSFKKVGT